MFVIEISVGVMFVIEISVGVVFVIEISVGVVFMFVDKTGFNYKHKHHSYRYYNNKHLLTRTDAKTTGSLFPLWIHPFLVVVVVLYFLSFCFKNKDKK